MDLEDCCPHGILIWLLRQNKKVSDVQLPTCWNFFPSHLHFTILCRLCRCVPAYVYSICVPVYICTVCVSAQMCTMSVCIPMCALFAHLPNIYYVCMLTHITTLSNHTCIDVCMPICALCMSGHLYPGYVLFKLIEY